MYEDQTYETILKRMLARVSDKFDKREGSVIWDTHSPTAIELQILYVELETLINESYGDTASREFLILLCKERGITPYAATNAVLKGEFTPSRIDVTGKRFNISDQNYVVLDKISDGVYQVQCEKAGESGNQYLGTMIPIEYIEGLETAQLTEVLIPGTNEEDTEDLRQRYFDSFGEFAFGGNRADYYAKVKELSGVGGVKIERTWNGGIAPAAMIPNAIVQYWYSNIVETLDDDVKAWLTAVYTAALNKWLTVGGTVLITITNGSDYGEASSNPGGLVESVQIALDPVEYAGEGYGIAPIGHIVTVKSATPVSIQISAQIAFNDGSTWASLKTAIESAVSNYLLSLRMDWENNDYTVVRVSQIESRILSVNGVVDVLDTKINGSTSNLTLTKYQIPIFGGITNNG